MTAWHAKDSTLKYSKERNEETVTVKEIQDRNSRFCTKWSAGSMGRNFCGWG